MLFVFTFYYLIFAISQNKQIHSLFHSISSFSLISYLFWKNSIVLLSWNVPEQILSLPETEALFCCQHSIGYFLADNIDIIFSEQKWRRRYLLHHWIAILGISTVYLGVSYSVFAIWCLELGGIVHHVKRMTAESFIQPLTSKLYFLVYGLSRIYFSGILFAMLVTDFSLTSSICFLTSLILTIQNFIWLYQNCK